MEQKNTSGRVDLLLERAGDAALGRLESATGLEGLGADVRPLLAAGIQNFGIPEQPINAEGLLRLYSLGRRLFGGPA